MGGYVPIPPLTSMSFVLAYLLLFGLQWIDVNARLYKTRTRGSVKSFARESQDEEISCGGPF